MVLPHLLTDYLLAVAGGEKSCPEVLWTCSDIGVEFFVVVGVKNGLDIDFI